MLDSKTTHMSWMQKAMKVAAGFILVATFIVPTQGLVPVVHAQEPGPIVASPQAAQAEPAKEKNKPGPETPAPECSFTQNWSLCLTNIIYVFTVGIMSIFAYIGGYVFDISIQLTLNSITYSQQFVTQGWVVVRDFANMTFIFMLVYIAMTVIFKAETPNTMHALAAVILVALLINFSFFASRLVIDAGNILAVQFYNAIDAPPLVTTATNSTTANVAKYFAPNATTKDMTYNIMQLIGVQTLLGPNSFSAAFFVKHGFWVNLIVFSFMYIAVGIILAILAFTFLVVGFKFLIRIVMLWIAIIASPLALVAGAMGRNKSGSAEKLFKLWYSTLIEYSFHPAVFLFMFWIVNSFAIELATSGNGNKDGILNAAFSDLGAITAGGDTGSFLVPIAAAVASISIRLGLVVILLFVAMKASDKIASSGSSGARSAAGWTGNKLSNAVAWGGRNSFGRLGYSYAQSNTGRALAAHSLLGKGLVVGARKLSGANYDVRGVKGLNTAILQTTGAKLSNAPATSFEKAYDAGVASRVNFANTLKPNERKLSDAYTQAVKNLKDDGKKQVLIQASAEYADAIEAQKDGSGERGAVKAAKEKYDAAVKDSGVIADAEKIAGANNHKTYADFMTKRSWYNGYGTNKNGTPFIISSTDKEAARKIRGEAKNNPDRLKKALESVNEENKKKKDGKGTPNTDQPNPRDGGSGGSSGGSGTGPTPQNGGGPSSRASVPSDTTSKVQDTMFKNQAKAAAEANETVVGAISSLQESNEKIGRKNIEEVQGLRKDMKGLHSAINEMREASATAPHLDASSGSVTGVLRGTPATDVLHTPTNLHANTTATAARTTPVPRVIPPQGQQPVKTPTTAIKPTVDEQVTPQVPLDGETIKPPPLHTLRAAPLPPNHPPASDK